MEERHIFVSVGGTSNPVQEDFVIAIEDRLRSEGLTPHTVGRNTFSSDAPLKAVMELLKTCSGTMVIALERSYFSGGSSKRGGPDQASLPETKLPTPWNQIEAAITYSLHLPLLVVVEAGLKQEGLLERGYDWYVQELTLDRGALTSTQFNGVLKSWKDKVLERPASNVLAQSTVETTKSVESMSIGDLVSMLKPAQLWSVLTAISSLTAAAFALGLKLHLSK